MSGIKRRQHLVTRFAVGSLAAFLLIGGALSVVVSRQLRSRAEQGARAHAVFVTDSILSYALNAQDLKAPIHGRRYRALADFVEQHIIADSAHASFRILRVKVWRRDGTIVFSDTLPLVGQRFEVDGDLKSAEAGRVVGSVADLSEAENRLERGLGTKLYATYVPLHLGATRTGRPQAVVELYQDYAGIDQQVSQVFRVLGLTLLVGLFVLYLVLLPLGRRTSSLLREQNAKLDEQAKRLEELLKKEKSTVAQLRDLNKLRGNFLAMVSHELRSPLTSIIGYVKTLRRPEFRGDDTMQEEFLGATERQADRLLNLVQNLLVTSRLEEQQLRVSVSTISLSELAGEVVGNLGPRGSRFEVALPPDLPDLVTDRDHLSLILTNLVDNALKYSPGETPCQLGARSNGQSIEFWVSDQGIGIAADELGRIFDRFYQVDSSSTRSFGGVGLGLSLVRNLVGALGGSIRVQSEPGRGSTFFITLPLRHPSATSSGTGVLGAPKPGGYGSSGAGPSGSSPGSHDGSGGSPGAGGMPVGGGVGSNNGLVGAGARGSVTPNNVGTGGIGGIGGGYSSTASTPAAGPDGMARY
jgi:signal transduction histidine kinase